MILWLILFGLVIAISFVLALQSMHDFQESPQHFETEYGLFLIRNTTGLTPSVLNSIHSRIIQEGMILSLERLFKGTQSALVIFGPKEVLSNYSSQLSLLELEDYTGIDKDHVVAWEVGVRDPKTAGEQIRQIDSFFKNLPALAEAEQFWWQLTIKAKSENKNIKLPDVKSIFGKPDMQKEVDYLMDNTDKKKFHTQIRAVVFSSDPHRRKKLSESLQNLSGNLTKVPKPFTSNQIIEFYKERSMGKDITNPTLHTEEVLKLTLLK